jgi:penicillin-insensitive murein endopeptidase
MPIDGPGYQAMRLSRHRNYGTLNLIDFIGRLTRSTVEQKVGVLLIGDMSQPRGGPMPANGHASHQTGLDVDIWYWLNPDAQYRPLTPAERENLSAQAVVDLKKMQLIKDAWRPEHVKMLEIASNEPDTERIFVNPVIKKELCETIPASKRAWLHKVRPWFQHHDHFHVRLKCPANQPACVTQDPVPAGDGCDQLAWWFTEEARKEEQKPSAEPSALPKLPVRCGSILSDPGVPESVSEKI